MGPAASLAATERLGQKKGKEVCESKGASSGSQQQCEKQLEQHHPTPPPLSGRVPWGSEQQQRPEDSPLRSQPRGGQQQLCRGE